MPLSPTELEERAERAVRRGELLAALEHFESYLAQSPDDERVRQRMESVRALLQPSELVSRRRADPEEAVAAEQLTDAEQGEMHASSGHFGEAVSAYARAVAKSPGNELLRERLDELRRLAEPPDRADLHAAEKLEPAAPPAPVSQRSARASDASFAPLRAPRPLPADPVEMLKDLLERVKAARRR